MMRIKPSLLHFSFVLCMLLLALEPGAAYPQGSTFAAPSMDQLLAYPFANELVASRSGDRLAWVEKVRGVRNVWFALANDSVPRRLTNYAADDGQEITQLHFSADGLRLLYVRGGDHGEMWPAKGNLAPDPNSDPSEPKVTIWSVATGVHAATPVEVAEGDGPALSSTGQVAFVRNGQIWTVTLQTGAKGPRPAKRLFFDRGVDQAPTWSPDGTRLAFVSGREDHSFIGVYTTPQQPLVYLAPSTSFDDNPVWSPDSRTIAFMRRPSRGNVLENFLTQQPHPFAFWTADSATGEGHQVWHSPDTLAGSLPDIGGKEPLFWMSGDQLAFLAEMDNWPHLYAVSIAGGNARLLTPGPYMVESVSMSPDRNLLVYTANTGSTAGDEDRRHLSQVRADGSAPEMLTSGEGIEWSPVALREGKVSYIKAGPRLPEEVGVLTPAGASRALHTGAAEAYPTSSLIIPTLVGFRSPDGVPLQGQLFRKAGVDQDQPAVVFVHGGPARQMLLGWHQLDYYCNAYAVNQFLANHGFTVLSVNYRLGVGYGRAFQHPLHAGPAGASEYQDVLQAARFLQQSAGVDANRIGVWGGSYGGYLTGLALARNSDVFKAGVDIQGISNWVLSRGLHGNLPEHWYDADSLWQKAITTAFASSPEADLATWRSPVLLVQGDDDRNVPFDQTVELAHRLEEQQTPLEELILPNEVHDLLRYADWLRVDEVTILFLSRHLLQSSPSRAMPIQ